MFSHFSGVTKIDRSLGANLIFTPNSWQAYSHVPQTILENLGVWGFKELEAPPLLPKYNRGTGVT